MFRIGFDPVLESEQQHRELIKQVQMYRLAQEALAGYHPKPSSGARLLALIGKGMASLGSNMESRFGDNPHGQKNINTQSNPGGCTS
jgi:hypothetical protein